MLGDSQIYDRIQRDFPLTERPFAMLSDTLGCSEEDLLGLLARDLDAGRISRLGAVFAPNVIGVSTLAALAAPPDEIDRLAAEVSALPEVSHNYARDGHRYNLWFVAGARCRQDLDDTLSTITIRTGLRPLVLPLEREFHIDLGFAMSGATRPARRGLTPTPARQTLNDDEWRLVAALEEGLPLTARPYHTLGERWGLSYGFVMSRLERWQASGLLRRFGAVLHHRRFGYLRNAMCVWDIPDNEVDSFGERLSRLAPVNLCYRRPRRLPDWPYNLFAMVHARDDEALGQALELFGQTLVRPAAVLTSRACYKQCATRYASAAERP